MAVSYTHLDVYKRQTFYCIMKMFYIIITYFNSIQLCFIDLSNSDSFFSF